MHVQNIITAFCEPDSYSLKTVFHLHFGFVTYFQIAVETPHQQIIKTFKCAESKLDRWHTAVGDCFCDFSFFLFYMEILSCVIKFKLKQISNLQ